MPLLNCDPLNYLKPTKVHCQGIIQGAVLPFKAEIFLLEASLITLTKAIVVWRSLKPGYEELTRRYEFLNLKKASSMICSDFIRSQFILLLNKQLNMILQSLCDH